MGDAAALAFTSRSPSETQDVGRRLAAHLRGDDVVALWGELGSGKTVLARGLATGLGADPGAVSSPTFVILHEHRGGRLPLFHLDLYRLESGGLGSTGWEECLEAGGVTAIEWPERAADLLPADRVDVRLEHVSQDDRASPDSARRSESFSPERTVEARRRASTQRGDPSENERRVVLTGSGPRGREIVEGLRVDAARA